MAGISLGVSGFKDSFFDRSAIDKRLDRALKRTLSKYGAFVRQRAKTSLRYKKGTSAAGDPPHAHRTADKPRRDKKTGVIKVRPVSLLREFLFFGYDASAKSVVIGPALLRNTLSRTRSASTIPELQEHGGGAVIPDDRTVGWETRGGQRVPIRARGSKSAKYDPRPFMRPAAAKETPKFMESLKDSV